MNYEEDKFDAEFCDKYYQVQIHEKEEVKQIGDGGNYPPLVLSPEWNGTHEIIDGSHRFEALKLLGRKVVKAYVAVKE